MRYSWKNERSRKEMKRMGVAISIAQNVAVYPYCTKGCRVSIA